MRRRIIGALTGAALLGGIVATQMATARPVAASCNATPHVSSVTNAIAHAGETVTVGGSGFTCGGSGNGTSLTVGGAGQHITALSDNQIQFQASGAAGSVVVTVSYPVLLGSQNAGSNTDHVLLMAPNAAQNLAKPGPGGTFTVSGSGFTMGGFLKTMTAAAQCPGGNVGLNISAISDTAVSLTAPGSYCSGGVLLAVLGYATTTKNATILTNIVTFGAGSIQVAPSPGGLSSGAATPGDTVSFSGAGFGNSGSASLNGAGIGSSWSDNSISFVVPAGATSGPVAFTRADNVSFGAGNLTVNSKITGISNPRAQGGDAVTIVGVGFGPGAGTVTVGGADMPVKSWSATSIEVTVPGSAGGDDVTVSPAGGNAASTAPGALTIMHLGALKPAAGAPGATIGITGSGFGSSKGAVTIAGVSAPVTIWGDSTIAVVVPSIPKYAGSGGDDHISISVPGAPSVMSAAFHVDPVPPPSPSSTPGQTPGNTPGNTPGSTPGSTGNPTGSSAPATAPTFIPPSPDGPIIQIGPVPFKPAPKVAGPVDLSMKSTQTVADPGVNVPFTVTLTAFGQPVVGAPVDLLLVVVPGGDASISPAKGVTDAQGRVSGILHLSKRAGDHIILARSGQYSDEIKVTGRGLANTGGAGGTDSGLGGGIAGGSPQRTIIVAALLACLVLFLSGFGINIATSRNAAAAAAASKRRGFGGTLVAVPVNAGAAAQFGLAMVICSFGQLVAALRRS
ncbi:MAG TPA: IPT/TIG domain-containing protein [Candidatus Dormibacteraeota bacterium]|jgi:hypothetical protein|nr:IPT/TIG domain-containing protein [Candidatus Dormibacteraeota bacterium]